MKDIIIQLLPTLKTCLLALFGGVLGTLAIIIYYKVRWKL